MSELIPLQCPSCAGHVDPVTLQCKMCGLAFKMKSDGTLMRIDVYPHKFIPIGSEILVPAYVIRNEDDAVHWSEYTLEKLAHNMAKQILPLMEYQTSFNIAHFEYITRGRIRVEEPTWHPDKGFHNLYGERY